MIDSIANLLFRCSHRRLTRPITPAGGPGEPGGTYVVCLDCGKQFSYDWKQMRLGPAIAKRTVKEHRTRFALLCSAVPLAVVLGKVFMSRRRTQAAGNLPPGEH